MKKSVCMKGNDPFTHTDYRIGFFPHSCECAKKSNSFERFKTPVLPWKVT